MRGLRCVREGSAMSMRCAAACASAAEINLTRILALSLRASVLLENLFDLREHQRDGQLGFDVAIISVRYSAGVLVVLREGPASEVMNRETKHDHLEGVSLLSAGLTPGVEHVAAIVEVTQVGLGGAHDPEILKHVAQFSTTSVNIVTFFEPACVM
jgi:hypothetical protein